MNTTETVPWFDLSRQYSQIAQEIQNSFLEVCAQTAFSGGPFVEQFEVDFSKHIGLGHVAAVNSGTSALQLALLAAGIQPGDEVIVPANTFIATCWAVSYANASIVFADCLDGTWGIDPSSVRAKITPKTKAVIGVHLYGAPCRIDELRTICDEHKLILIEDAAQCVDATFKSKPIGYYGDLACYSFYPGKNLGAYGEGGAVTSKNEEWIKHIKRLRNHGTEVRYYHDEIGFNMRMDGIQAAILSVKLPHLPNWTKRRRKIAQRYDSEIANTNISLSRIEAGADSAYHLYVVTVANRDEFMKFLAQEGIGSGIHYPVPCHLQKAYASLGGSRGDLPVSEELASRCVSLPMFPELTDEEVIKVIHAVNKYKPGGN